jgi:hypothetical protein
MVSSRRKLARLVVVLSIFLALALVGMVGGRVFQVSPIKTLLSLLLQVLPASYWGTRTCLVLQEARLAHRYARMWSLCAAGCSPLGSRPYPTWNLVSCGMSARTSAQAELQLTICCLSGPGTIL